MKDDDSQPPAAEAEATKEDAPPAAEAEAVEEGDAPPTAEADAVEEDAPPTTEAEAAEEEATPLPPVVDETAVEKEEAPVAEPEAPEEEPAAENAPEEVAAPDAATPNETRMNAHAMPVAGIDRPMSCSRPTRWAPSAPARPARPKRPMTETGKLNGGALSRKVSAVQNMVKEPKPMTPRTSDHRTTRSRATTANTDAMSVG